ncbi:hypothetical protein [Mycetocola saprophilus]|uniref:hypothetical protein n=1 Tax=Mycetocola saprophilus TaxID=76636 RepID=UPI0004C0FF80|nr:hypothetical protein [Mycetocola saprophilus]
MTAAESVNNGPEDADGPGGLRDYGSTSLTELDLDITGVERLVLPESLTHLTVRGFSSGSAYVSVEDLVEGLSGLGAVGIPVTEVSAAHSGRDLSVRVVGGMPALDGLENVRTLRVEEIALLDLDDVVDSFPALTSLELSGDPGRLVEVPSLAELTALEHLTLRGFPDLDARTLPDPAFLPVLGTLTLAGFPDGTVAELRARYPRVRIVIGAEETR